MASVHERIGPGEKAPDLVNVLIEIPMGSNIKYEFDEEKEIIIVDRFLYTAMVYPFNYGFIPGTLEEDGDPVDVLVISSMPVLPGTIIEAKPIGILEMEDEEGPDSKIIAVPKEKVDPIYGRINDVDELPEIIKSKIKHFFEHYKELEPGKWTRVTGFKGAENAKEKIRQAIERFKKK
ncbi:inorganic diphosphatase [Pyrofollis japonicus]|uniref:inorganic diphosphatase n=1 Tax=Pyrofollis japonicus TaxID=3060460 RepID=UPI00295B9281|nr:inorganic diphosphatase [Pyrofollis japonicus]BEP17085.1 inorganic diphosphatase [Pyrofollis japonicus]